MFKKTILIKTTIIFDNIYFFYCSHGEHNSFLIYINLYIFGELFFLRARTLIESCKTYSCALCLCVWVYLFETCMSQGAQYACVC